MNQAEQESLGSIQTRVHHLEQGMAQLSRNVQEGFTRLTEQLQTDRRPQWQAYGVMLTGIVVLGTMAYWPIREQQTRLETLILKMDEGKVSREEFVLTQERGKEYRERFGMDMARSAAETQRQIDELKRAAGETYSLRDVVVELKQNQKEIQDMVLRGRNQSQ